MTDAPTPPQPMTATVSPGRTSAACLTAPYAVNTLQPMMAASPYEALLGRGNTELAGTTQCVASPLMEYMATGLPSSLNSRVVPSYMTPRTRL